MVQYGRPSQANPRGERWTPLFGQFSVAAKVGSGFMIQAASSPAGCGEARRSPSLRAAPSSVFDNRHSKLGYLSPAQWEA